VFGHTGPNERNLVLLDFPVQRVPTKELVVLPQLELSRCVLLILEACVPAHAGDTAIFLLCTLEGDDHSSALCLLGHVVLISRESLRGLVG
jgi:hypothetical protein